MSIEQLLFVTTAVLVCSCFGTLAIRLTNARLLGLGWLSASFAVGGLGTALLLGARHLPAFPSLEAPDLLVLLSFALLHLAVLDLVGVEAHFRPSLLLLGLQSASYLVVFKYGLHPRVGVSVAALLVALQTGHTAFALLRKVRKGTRAASYFNVMLLVGITAFQSLRSIMLGMGRFDGPSTLQSMETLTLVSYLAFTLAIGFGIFWMASSTLFAELENLASTDPLTRLYNRRVFLKWCNRIHGRSRENSTAFSILIADLDHFKAINDKFGHSTGDAVLCTAVERMQDAVRGIDILGRWGGEEFVALLPGASAEAAMLVAQRVRRNVERSVVSVTGKASAEAAEGVRVTLSVGVATFRGDEDTVDLMMQRADKALYAAKASGRNQVSVDGLQVPEFFTMRHARMGTR